MKVQDNGDGTYTYTAILTEDELLTLGALADFPLWSMQPVPVADFCARLWGAVREMVPVSAEALGMVPETTVVA